MYWYIVIANTSIMLLFFAGLTIDTLEDQKSYQLTFGKMDADDSKTIE
jgi:hypothetical protein